MICAATGPSSRLPFGVAGSAIHDLDFSHSLERLRYMRIGYARVSKADGSQSLDLERDALRAEGIDDPANPYHDFASGVRDDRPGLDSCLRALRRGDVLVVWKLDRLGPQPRPLGQHRAGSVRPRRVPRTRQRRRYLCDHAGPLVSR